MGPRTRSTPFRVLHIEDDPADARRVREMLRDSLPPDTELLHAETLLEGVERLAQERPDVLLLDLSLPGLQGLEAFRMVSAVGTDVPVVLVAGPEGEELAHQAAEAGAQDFLVKGRFEAEGLSRSVSWAVERGRLLRASRGAEHSLEERVLQQAAVAELGERASAAMELPPLLEEAVRRVRETLRVDHVGLLRLAPDRSRLFVEVEAGWKDGLVGQASRPAASASLAAYTLASNGPVIVADLESERRFAAARILLEHGVRSGMSVPVSCGEGRFEVLAALSCRLMGFSRDDAYFLRSVAGVLGSTIQRLRAQEELRRSEERYRRLFENNLAGVFRATPDGRLLDCNRSFARIFGFADPAEVLRSGELDLARILDQGSAAWSELRHGGSMVNSELCARLGEGAPIWLLASAAPAHTAAGEPIVEGVVIEVTDRKRLEEHLHQVQRIESVGRLAGGVAHDFNNLLTAILGNSELLLQREALEDAGRGEVLEIRKAGERAASLTRQLLAFSRRQVLQPTVLDLNKLVRDILVLVQRLIGENIEVRQELASDLGRVSADPSQIEQVIMNLAVNARDAMPDGGSLTFTTSNQEIDRAFVHGHPGSQPGSYVRLQVRDTGHGVEPELLPLIFDPFFTTKEVGKGTGLGLAMVYGVVKQSGGYIGVDSRPGEGTEFSILLPRIEAPSERAEEAAAAGEDLSGGETLLVVEDEPAVRHLVCEILRRFGYAVLSAGGGEEALRQAATFDGRIDLLITDLVMPGLSGRQLADRLQSSRPEIEVLFTSGYTDDAAFGDESQHFNFLQKPFASKVLATTVRAIFHTKKAAGGG